MRGSTGQPCHRGQNDKKVGVHGKKKTLHPTEKESDRVQYFAAPENKDLGIVKQKRKPKARLIVSPFPSRQRSPEEFFFQPDSQTPLTTGLQP